jgi:hypothetical protein
MFKKILAIIMMLVTFVVTSVKTARAENWWKYGMAGALIGASVSKKPLKGALKGAAIGAAVGIIAEIVGYGSYGYSSYYYPYPYRYGYGAYGYGYYEKEKFFLWLLRIFWILSILLLRTSILRKERGNV